MLQIRCWILARAPPATRFTPRRSLPPSSADHHQRTDPIRLLATIAACPHGAVIPLISALRRQAPQWRKRLPDFFYLVMIIARWGRAPSWRKSFHSQLPEAKAHKNSSASSSEFFSEKQHSQRLLSKARFRVLIALVQLTDVVFQSGRSIRRECDSM